MAETTNETINGAIKPKRQRAIISEVIHVNAEINLYKLVADDQQDFNFLPGQFVMVILKDKEGKEIRRAYSIASSPYTKGHIELCVKYYENGKLSPLLFKLKKGDHLDIDGPYGKYTLQRPLPGEMVCIAAGTGIAPIMSFIRTAVVEKALTPITLFYGFRYPHDFIYRDELLQYSRNYRNITVLPTISTKEAVDWNGHRGYVQDIAQQMLRIGKSTHAYLCGPPGMVTSAQKMLLDMGMKKEDIFKEQWE
ncbi:FAD-dependent oxidoreductase [Candidatus Woesearchaeota archaeon]|nr:FAD-dependent oxidoreductase [Candidatus Woesearchaeota archaeon]